MKKAKKRKYIFIGTITIVLGILSFIVYQSYAYFKVNYTGNIINTIVGAFGSYEYVYTGTVQEFTVPVTGYYEIETWGAGSSYDTGGYAKGLIELNKDETIFVYIGAYGSISTTEYGFNGAGPGSLGGGGATDIRLVNGIWNNSASLRSRIIVAGGGGGRESSSTDCPPSVGGNLIGGNSYESCVHYNLYTAPNGKGGTQTVGGTGGQYEWYQFSGNGNGTFGQGGSGASANDVGAGGGGGYYGGGATTWAGVGGGGSSYISGYAGVNSVQETGGTATQPLHTNNTMHYSGKYFIKGSMQAGINTGDGKAKITYVGTEIPERTNTKLDNVRYLKSCSTSNSNNANSWAVWHELQVVKNGINIAKGKTITGDKPSHTAVHATYSNITDGDIGVNAYGHGDTIGANCIYLDLGAIENVDEIGIWAYYGNTKVSPTSYTLLVSANNTNWTTIHDLTNHVATSQGLHYTAWD